MCLILSGRPASGKSTFTMTHFVPNGYIRVNRDQLGTQAKCKKAVELAFGEGKSVVIDNTNPSRSGALLLLFLLLLFLLFLLLLLLLLLLFFYL
jgi:bifunctional polynucleotide phosphatase/kinase